MAITIGTFLFRHHSISPAPFAMGREKEKQHFFDPVGPFLDRQSHLQEKVRFSARQNLSFSQRLLME